AGVGGEGDRACAGELEGGDVELQGAGGADLDAVGGVEVVDDERGGCGLALEIDGAAGGLDLAGQRVVDAVLDLQGVAGCGGLERAAGFVLDGVVGVEDEGAAVRLDQAVVQQGEVGDRADAGDLIAVVVEDVGGGDAGDRAGVGGEGDRACAGELEGGDVELQGAGGADL